MDKLISPIRGPEVTDLAEDWLVCLQAAAGCAETLVQSWRVHVPAARRLPEREVRAAADAHWHFLKVAVGDTSLAVFEQTKAIRMADTTGRRYYDVGNHGVGDLPRRDAASGAATHTPVFRAMAWFGILSRRLADEVGIVGAIPMWRGLNGYDTVPETATAVSSAALTFEHAARYEHRGCVLHARVKAEAVIGVTVNDPEFCPDIDVEHHPLIAPYVLAQGPTAAATGHWSIATA